MAVTNETLNELLTHVCDYEERALKIERRAHCERVAALCEKMAVMYGENAEKAYVAGMAHDICKNLEDEQLMAIALSDGEGLSEVEKNKPSLLHGRAGAVMLKNVFGVEDKEILESVKYHTVGQKGLCNLAKIVFAADKIEPGRKNITQQYLDEVLTHSLNEVCLIVLEENLEFLAKKGRQVSLETYEFIEYLKSGE